MSFIKKNKIISIVLISNFLYFNNANSVTTVLSHAVPVQSTGQVQYNIVPSIGQLQASIMPNNGQVQTGLVQNNGQVTYQVQGSTSPVLNQANTGIYSVVQTQQPTTTYSNNLYTNNLAQANYGTTTVPYSTTTLLSSNQQVVTNASTNGRIYNKQKTKSCYTEYINSQDSYILDFSDTYDINTNGDVVISLFIQKARENNYTFVYIDLCNTEVQPLKVNQWNQLLKQYNIQVTWNLSNNSIIDDTLFTYYLRDLSNIKGLNISNTNVSANGILQLSNLLQSNIDSPIQFINICGLNIDWYTKSILTNTFAQHKTAWEQRNNKKYVTYENGIIDSYSNSNNNINLYNTNGIQQTIIPNTNQQQYISGLGLQQSINPQIQNLYSTTTQSLLPSINQQSLGQHYTSTMSVLPSTQLLQSNNNLNTQPTSNIQYGTQSITTPVQSTLSGVNQYIIPAAGYNITSI